jgi:hypothetical protein
MITTYWTNYNPSYCTNEIKVLSSVFQSTRIKVPGHVSFEGYLLWVMQYRFFSIEKFTNRSDLG